MILIADSGSTKTCWALVDADHVYYEQTEGLNPYFVDYSKVKTIVEQITRKHVIEAVYFYGAGCNSDEKKDVIRTGIFNAIGEVKLTVESDLLGAARAVYGNHSGWIVILGTGSNVAFFNGIELKKYRPSLGFILGDEGSGAHIGKLLLKKLLYNELPHVLAQDFYNRYPISNANDILTNIYSKPFPNRYIAQFTNFVSQYIHMPEIKEIVKSSFDELIKMHILPFYHTSEPVSFVGSIAFVFKELLIETANTYDIPVKAIVQNPINGLVNYHRQRYYQR